MGRLSSKPHRSCWLRRSRRWPYKRRHSQCSAPLPAGWLCCLLLQEQDGLVGVPLLQVPQRQCWWAEGWAQLGARAPEAAAAAQHARMPQAPALGWGPPARCHCRPTAGSSPIWRPGRQVRTRRPRAGWQQRALPPPPPLWPAPLDGRKPRRPRDQGVQKGAKRPPTTAETGLAAMH